MRKSWSIISTAVLVGACNPDDGVLEKPVGEPVTYSAIEGVRGSNGLEDRLRLVVTSSSQWDTVWESAMSNRSPIPPAPVVDFQNEMVVLASMGTRPDGGYTIEITDVRKTVGELVVNVLERDPGDHCALTQVQTAPAVAIRFERIDLPVRFVDATGTNKPCK